MVACGSLKNLVENVIFLPVRIRASVSSHRKYAVRKQTLTVTRHTLERFIKDGVENHKIVFNVAVYLLLLDQDLADFTDYIINSTGDRKRVFIAKHEAVLLYEASEDITQLIGREFRDAAIAMGISDEQVSKLNAVSSEINNYWLENRVFLKNIRNMVASHREKNALCYLQNLEQLNPIDVMKHAVDFSERIEKLLGVITNIALTCSSQRDIFRDMLESYKKKHV